MSFEEMLRELTEERGALVASADCSETEMALAQKNRHFYGIDDLGFVLRGRLWREGAEACITPGELTTKCFWIQAQKPTRAPASPMDWETIAAFPTEEEARMAIADSGKFPMNRSLRIVEVKVVV